MNKIAPLFLFIITIFALPAFAQTSGRQPPIAIPNIQNPGTPVPNQPQPTTQKSFAGTRTQLNTETTEELPDNGYTPSFITGTKTPIDIDRLGAGISVITSEVIEEMKPLSIIELLRIVPGVIITERGTNYVTASIQGAPAGQTTVMVDGISMNSPADRERAVDISSINININTIERIEIIRNPASIGNNYGATGGIINIVTKNGEEQEYTVAIYGDMTFDLKNKLNGYNSGINFAGSKPTLNYALSYNRKEENGVSQASDQYGNNEKDGFGSNNAIMRFSITPIEGLKSGVYINYTDFYKELDNTGGSGGDNSDYKLKLENILFGWDISYNLQDIWEPSLKLHYKFMNKKYINRNRSDIFFGNGTYNGQQVVFDFNNNFYIADEFTLSVGAEYIYDMVDIKEINTVEKPLKTDEHSLNAYAQATIDLFESWVTVISAKGDFYGLNSAYGYLPTYGVSTAYNIEPIGLTLKASFGTGAMTPTIYQLQDREFGNTNLKPEESMSYQAGFTNNIADGIFIWGGSWFENFYKNMITRDASGKFQNTGKAHTYGVEASLRVNPVDFMSIFGTYTWLNAFTLEGGKKRMDLMPEHSVVGGVIFRAGKFFSVNFNVNYVSDKDDLFNFAMPTALKQYYLLNTAMSFNLVKNFEIYLTGTNLMDTRYESSAGYGTKGLEIAVGLRIKM